MDERRFEFLKSCAERIREAILPHLGQASAREASHIGFSGDTTYAIDAIAESALEDAIKSSDFEVAFFSEDKGLVKLAPQPEILLVVDPIDGTLPLLCNLEACVVSIALCDYSEVATFGSIQASVILEIKNGDWHYAERGQGTRSSLRTSLKPSETQSLEKMFWSFDTIGGPVYRVMHYLGKLIDQPAACAFMLNSSAYSLTRIATGQLDAYVDVRARILHDFPESDKEFRALGDGRIIGAFPYDVAGAFLLVRESGAVITDAHGKPLDDVFLIQHGEKAIMSCVAAGNPVLHQKLITALLN